MPTRWAVTPSRSPAIACRASSRGATSRGGRCYRQLMDRIDGRIVQEVDRPGGDYAHVLGETIEPGHDDSTGEAWMYGRFDYELYRADARDANRRTQLYLEGDHGKTRSSHSRARATRSGGPPSGPAPRSQTAPAGLSAPARCVRQGRIADLVHRGKGFGPADETDAFKDARIKEDWRS